MSIEPGPHYSSPASAFDGETAVIAISENNWSAAISPAWNIGQVPNGGYSLAVVLGAMAEAAATPDPLSVTCHFLRPVSPDIAATVRTDVVRSGRAVSTVAGRLIQDGRDRLLVTAAMGDLDPTRGAVGDDDDAVRPGWAELEAPDLPPPEQCVARTGDAQGVSLALRSRIEVRLPPEHVSTLGRGAAEVSGWIRFVDDRPPDTRALVLFADAFPPSLFGRLGPVGWVPTIELTVHIRRRPSPGWVMGRFRCDDLCEGRMIEDGALWDASGALVARSRQLGLLL